MSPQPAAASAWRALWAIGWALALGCDDDGRPHASRDASHPDAAATDAGDRVTDSGRGDADALDAAMDDPLRPPPYPATPHPEGNPPSAAKAMLGKVLFWDEQLSSDDTVACGTCHRPAAGGADPRTAAPIEGHPGEDGVLGTQDDPRGSPGIARCAGDSTTALDRLEHPSFGTRPQVTRRRSMSFMDTMLSNSLFWDGRAADRFEDPLEPGTVRLETGAALESQAVVPILDSAEMACEGRTWQHVVQKLEQVTPLARATALPAAMADALAARPDYPTLFEGAFGSPEITPARIAFAIASYERQLRSDETPLDRFARGDGEALSPAERRGYEVFLGQARCSCCHVLPELSRTDFIDDGFRTAHWDRGREEVTGDPLHRGAFRVPPLRNVGLREAGGLLHDGLAPGASLEALVNAYDAAPVSNTNNLCRRALGLTAAQRADLVEFLRHGLTDPRARDERPPFDRPRLASE